MLIQKLRNVQKLLKACYMLLESLFGKKASKTRSWKRLLFTNEQKDCLAMNWPLDIEKPNRQADWWGCYGSSAPTLQQFAIKILSLTCSASGCERNWSTFEHIHTKKRNRIDQKRLNDVVYIKYNLTLLSRFEMRHSVDPISLTDIDESNEWLTGIRPEDADEELVYENDPGLTWNLVASASGANEERFNLRSRGSRNGGQGSSQTQPLRIVEEEEEEEEDDGAYKSGSEVNEDAIDDLLKNDYYDEEFDDRFS